MTQEIMIVILATTDGELSHGRYQASNAKIIILANETLD